jgi:hypothetical protein
MKTKNKRTISQAVFDSHQARKITKAGHEQAVLELAKTPRHKLDKSNPNNPYYDFRIFEVNTLA